MNRKLLILMVAAIGIARVGLLLIKKSQPSPENVKPAQRTEAGTSNLVSVRDSRALRSRAGYGSVARGSPGFPIQRKNTRRV